MEMREAQPYRVPFTTFRGVVEHRDLQFAGHSPPRRLVCARCRVVSTTELRYESASRAGDFACGACARINVNQRCGQPPRLDRGDSAELEERPEGDWKEPQKPSDRDVELLNDCEVRICPFSTPFRYIGTKVPKSFPNWNGLGPVYTCDCCRNRTCPERPVGRFSCRFLFFCRNMQRPTP